MKCEICEAEFDLKKITQACKKQCQRWGSCGLTPCPNCFFENVLDPEWHAKLFGTQLKSWGGYL